MHLVIGKRGIPDEELPVDLYLATRARVASGVILDLRLKGLGWMDITLRYGLSPEIFYVPVKYAKVALPYGNAYGYYKKHPRNEWKKVIRNDADVVNLVNLKFMSEYHGYAPKKVTQIRAEGKTFGAINGHIKEEKNGKHGKNEDSGSGGDDQDKGRGKDKGEKW